MGGVGGPAPGAEPGASHSRAVYKAEPRPDHDLTPHGYEAVIVAESPIFLVPFGAARYHPVNQLQGYSNHLAFPVTLLTGPQG
jgi:hypothetical protein